MSDAVRKKRTIRSFVRRTGRITPGQSRALAALWPKYGIDYTDQALDFDRIFDRNSSVVLEIGFGDGENLLQQAEQHPDLDYVGIEVHQPGVGHCLIGASEKGLENLRVISHDAIDVLQHQVPDARLGRVNLLFPDPWPKKRHHKRRIVQHSFLQLVANKLRPDGHLYIATDWKNYAEHIDDLLSSQTAFAIAVRREHGGERPLARSGTKFESRGLRKGHRIFDWHLVKNDDRPTPVIDPA